MESVSSILKLVSSGKTKREKVDLLRSNDSHCLREILIYALHPNVKWLLPEGDPPYTPLEESVDVQGRLFSEVRKLYLFVEGGNPNVKQIKREFLFLQLLESIDPEDAKLLLAVKGKKIPYKGITPSLVREAFPGLI